MTLIPGERAWRRWIGWAAFGASTANFVSIALAHAILAAGILLLLLRPKSVRVPRIAWPILALVAWTLVAMAASDAPAAALPQIKKFFVLAMLPLVYTAFRGPAQCRRVAEAWFVVVSASCLVAVGQFATSAAAVGSLGTDFYGAYVDDRITGFQSHWMTFSQSSILVLAVLGAWLLFGRRRPGRAVWAAAGGVICLALLLSFTRSVWLAAVACGLYALAVLRPRALPLVPVALAVAYLAAPDALQQRVRSIRPEANQARIVMWRTGLNMITERPLTGVGPERAGPLFSEYQPEDVEELPPGFYGHLHNVFVHFAAERGIPAALIVLWLFAQVLWDMRAGLRQIPAVPGDRRFLMHAGVMATLAVAVLSCFDVSLGDSEVLAAYLAAVAIAYRGLGATPAGPARR